eukprot:355759-Chlamydomonas_euryale.AAC.3
MRESTQLPTRFWLSTWPHPMCSHLCDHEREHPAADMLVPSGTEGRLLMFFQRPPALPPFLLAVKQPVCE